MTIVVNTRIVRLLIITLTVHRCFGAVSPLVLSTNEPEKNGNLVITAISNDTKIDWIKNETLPAMSSCIFNLVYCTASSSSNIAFAVNSTSTSMTITSLSYNDNNLLYKAESETGASASIQIIVSSPLESVAWLNPPPSTCPKTVSFVTLTAVIPCVYPVNEIVVVFQMFEQNGSFNISVKPENIGNTGCASHEVNLKATSTLTSSEYPNRKFQVLASVTHNLLKSKAAVTSNLTDTICFQGDDNCSYLWKLFLLLLLIDFIVFILLLYKKIKEIEQWDFVKILNIAQNCCGKWIFIELRFAFVVMLVIKCILAIIVLPILIEKGKCPVEKVIGIAFALIVVCPVFYMFIFWIVIWYVCHRKTAVNRVDTETTSESKRSPGRQLPPLQYLTQTDLDKIDKTEKKKKKKKKKKAVYNEEEQAETYTSEINHEVYVENLPKTNKIIDS